MFNTIYLARVPSPPQREARQPARFPVGAPLHLIRWTGRRQVLSIEETWASTAI